jgi:hypothetical protein
MIFFNGKAVNPNKDTAAKKKTRMDEFLETIMDESCNGGLPKEQMILRVFPSLWDGVISPDTILRTMDVAGHKLSLQGWDVVRAMVKEQMPQVKLWQLPFPGTTTIQHFSSMVEFYANENGYTYEISNLPAILGSGEMVKFDFKEIIPLILKASGLDEEAKIRRVTLPLSCDTTDVSKN